MRISKVTGKLKGFGIEMCLVACVLAGSMLFNSCIGFAATVFLDKDDIDKNYSWAAEAINEMTDKGIISGIAGGTPGTYYFSPGSPVKKLDALILASKVLGVHEEINKAAADRAEFTYTSVLSKYSLPYGTREIAYLIAQNVIVLSELDDYLLNYNDSMLRHEVAVLLVKVLGKESEVKNQTLVILPYLDQNDIPEKVRPYADYLLKNNIMAGDGKNFNPNAPVNRAEISVLLYKVMGQLVFDQGTLTNGTLVSINTDKKEITIRKEDGKDYNYNISNVPLVIDGFSGEFGNLEIGMRIKLRVKDLIVLAAEAERVSGVQTLQGIVVTASGHNGQMKLTVRSDDDGKSNEVIANGLTLVYKVGQTANLEAIDDGDYVRIEMDESQKPVVITVLPRNRTVKGTVIGVNLEDGGKITVADSDNNRYTYAADLDIEVIRNNRDVLLKDIRIGDRVELELSYEKVKYLYASGTNDTLEGTIEELIISREPKITVRDESGKLNQYRVTRDSKIYIGSDIKDFYDLRVGMQVKLTLESNMVTKIDAVEVKQFESYTGVILAFNKNLGVLTISIPATSTEPAKEKQLFVQNSSVTVTNAKTGAIMNYDELKSGLTITAFGRTELGVFVVTQIVVMN